MSGKTDAEARAGLEEMLRAGLERPGGHLAGGAMASTYEEAFVLERANLANAELVFMKFNGDAEQLRSYRAMTKDLVFPQVHRIGVVADDDLRLFASIELAAALAGVPGPAITQMKQPNPLGSRSFGSGWIISSEATGREDTDGPRMRSPDGRLIRCPQCLFQPSIGLRWTCKCGHSWNTFWTSGRCPACQFQWEVTQCPG